MQEKDWLTTRFDENRAQLRAVAYRMLGSASEAEDAEHGKITGIDLIMDPGRLAELDVKIY